MQKKFFNIDEISELIQEKKHTIRFWEGKIDKLEVLRTQSGHRLYNYENYLILKKIKYLINIKKLTLDGINMHFQNTNNFNPSTKSISVELKKLLSILKSSN
ncbi:MAG: hypothetical protein CMI90_01290 [Pelagibacteraceae bacterium]|jgi:DNA-binding transcriptional MerR regulator|nr:hypothetical protein [Pelagibacteraceae bacterium]